MSREGRRTLRRESPRPQKMSPRAPQRPLRGNSPRHDSPAEKTSVRQQHDVISTGSSIASGSVRNSQETKHVVPGRKKSDRALRKEQARRKQKEQSPEFQLRSDHQRSGLLAWLELYGPSLTNEEFLKHIGRLIDQLVPNKRSTSSGVSLGQCFWSATCQPPITKKSLSELDISAIIVNPKLRHDVNFDRELHFRPNLDGDRGKEKVQDAEKYWLALEAELELYTILFGGTWINASSPVYSRCVEVSKRRIPIMFETVRGVLVNLVPERDQARVEEHLDEDMLMQQIEKGVCDLVGLSKWLSHLLKAHCAPMRDEWVDKMVQDTKQGVEKSSAKSIVDGLRELLGILEAMKLDVANHQIRHLRALFIEDTVNFETKYQLNRIRSPKKIDVEACRTWFTDAKHLARRLPFAPPNKYPRALKLTNAQPQFVIFLQAILHQLLDADSKSSLPQSFYLDADRLRSIKAELQDLVYFDACCRVFNWLIARILNREHATAQPLAINALREALLSVVTEPGDSTKQWVKNIANVAVEMVRHALAVCGFGHQQYDADLVQHAEHQLRENMTGPYPNHIALQAERIEQTLLPLLLEQAERHVSSSPIDLFNALVGGSALGTASRSQLPTPPPPPPPPVSAPMGQHQRNLTPRDPSAPFARPPPPPPPPPPVHPPHFVDLARRLTHIAVLHWQVWAPIVYLKDEILPSEAASSTESSMASSPTFNVGPATGGATLSQLPIRGRSATVDETAMQKMGISASDLDVSQPSAVNVAPGSQVPTSAIGSAREDTSDQGQQAQAPDAETLGQ